ncbi:MAG: metal ABC transporter solute-binding protein, Zn/Mn family [Pirellulales bacterium]
MLRGRLSTVWPLLALLTASLAGCGSEPHADGEPASTPPAASKTFSGQYPIKIVCTTGQVADMLRNIGGEHVEVTALMGPGVDPHLYRESPSDIEKLSSADAIFYNGVHLEGRMTDVFEKLSARRPTFAVTDGLVAAKDSRLRKPPEFEGYYDPHVWHDPKIWSDCVRYVATKLSELDPAHRDDYAANSAAYEKQLADLDTECRAKLAEIPKPQRVLVTAHDAFGYFCITYDIESMPLGGVTTEEEVSIGRMDEVINFIVDRKVKAVFVESAVAPRIVEALIEPCRKKGHDVQIGGQLYADALGAAGTPDATYIGMIRANVETIVKALK